MNYKEQKNPNSGDEPAKTPFPSLREFTWQIYSQEAQKEKDLLLEVFLHFLTIDDDWVDYSRLDIVLLYKNLSHILDYQIKHLPVRK